MFMAISREC